MKSISFLLIALSLSILSFTDRNGSGFDIKSIKRDFAKIKPDLFVSKFEVTNSDYREFLADLTGQNQLELYNKCLPDTLVWQNNQTTTDPLTTHYFRDPAYNKFPVVGITYDAANEYCKWLTEKYNQTENKTYKQVLFKLPTRAEWISAANKGNVSRDYTWGSGFLQNNRNEYLCNYTHKVYIFDSTTKKYNEFPDTTQSNAKVRMTTVSVDSYFPNSFGIFNMCGNVAEMIEEKGIAKGGGFTDAAYYVRIASEKTYTKPQVDIGFRVAMKIVEQ